MSLIPAWIDGTLTPVDKLEVHQRGLRHPAISVFVMDGARTLLQCRAGSKYHTPGLWTNACCTHPHWGEEPDVCAARRLDEELGITGLPLAHRAQIEYRADVGGGLTEHELVDVYVAHGRPQPIPNPEEVSDTRWITLDALRAETEAVPERFTPWLRIYLTQHADRIFAETA